MSILIRYSCIHFYFHFSITSSTSSIHHYAPPQQHNHTHTCFIRPISFIWWTHVLLKPKYCSPRPEVKDTLIVRVYQNRDETESLCRPDFYSSTGVKLLYINGSESSSLYTHNTSWCSVHYMILTKPLVRLTTVHYQSAVSMISFAQVLTAQWSDTIPCQNVQFQVRITSPDIPFQHSH